MSKQTRSGFQKLLPESFLASSLVMILRYKGTILRRVWKNTLWVMLPTVVFCTLHDLEWMSFSDSISLPSILGAALGVLLVFRNNTAYERWWEARKVLGALVNDSRSFALATYHYLRPEDPDRAALLALIKAFPFALKEHLRDGVIFSELQFLSSAQLAHIRSRKHRPVAIGHLMFALIKRQYERGHLTDILLTDLNHYVEKLMDILGKCERIRNTPMPQAHTYLLRTYIFIYVLTMPFGFVGVLGWWSVLAIAVIYFLSMSLVIIAEEIEDPFGTDVNDLPVDAIAQNIYGNICEVEEGLLAAEQAEALL